MDVLLLILIWGLLFLSVRRKIKSGYIYFFFLIGMLLPLGIKINPDNSFSWVIPEVSLVNMLAFGLCLVGGFLPWYAFDKWSYNRVFYLNYNSISKLKTIFTITIVCSLFSILYLLPYSVKAILLGANYVRSALYSGESAFLPESIFTTIAVAIAACHIYAILFFYIACLSPELKKYRIWLIISSLSYIFNCFAITARDGLIILPLFYLVFYLIFKDSIHPSVRQKLKRQLSVLVIISVIFIAIFSIDRFYRTKSVSTLYEGTVGYISQQRFVFDETIKKQNDFWGFEVRFPLVNRLLGIKKYEVNRRDHSFEWQFGTMYGEFYDAFAWKGLILISLSFILFYTLSIKFLISRKQTSSVLLMFCIYLYIDLTGMFYTRAGGFSMNLFCIVTSVFPFFCPNFLSSQIKNYSKKLS